MQYITLPPPTYSDVVKVPALLTTTVSFRFEFKSFTGREKRWHPMLYFQQ